MGTRIMDSRNGQSLDLEAIPPTDKIILLFLTAIIYQPFSQLHFLGFGEHARLVKTPPLQCQTCAVSTEFPEESYGGQL